MKIASIGTLPKPIIQKNSNINNTSIPSFKATVITRDGGMDTYDNFPQKNMVLLNRVKEHVETAYNDLGTKEMWFSVIPYAQPNPSLLELIGIRKTRYIDYGVRVSSSYLVDGKDNDFRMLYLSMKDMPLDESIEKVDKYIKARVSQLRHYVTDKTDEANNSTCY